MPASSPERDKANREEIMSAAERLYAEHDFRDISLNDIAKLTSLSRPSIYNYFQTKEEIFLSLLEREHRLWIRDIRAIDPKKACSKRSFSNAMASTLQNREFMLKIMVSNLYDIENNSSMDALVSLKRAYRESVTAVKGVVGSCFPQMGKAKVDSFVELFFPFVFGIYPYSHHSKKQKEAMEAAGIHAKEHSIKELASAGINRLLGEI